ncbi:diacylglycerol/lipid kinase family protein [Streptococcus dysgalactiae]|uniref:diacylglycerol/lipid kinase family protein n=1 Tax=Streptococcus dysgalactiae TaxID=1334 RepID=UPI000824EF2F|nr:diacylglycerol kinase family protein [Streptococcus dysgalactiae]OCX02826.1 diacylglycerol kinase [Streptococcus dysgalactiae subsp. equisimilis]
MKTVRIFYNPNSGKKEDQLASDVRDYFLHHGFSEKDVEVITPKDADQAFLLAKQAAKDHIDLVIPLGGDGTLNKIIGGVYEGGAHCLIGLVPSGTVNNFAKALHAPLQTSEALDTILSGQVKKVDICKANHHYMISSLTLGLLADIAADVTADEKRRFGPLAFLKDSIRILRRNRSYHISLISHNHHIHLKTKFLLITMTNTIAGFPSFSPGAQADDGYFQVYTMKKVSFFKFLWHINDLRQGDFSKAEEISHFQANSLTLQPQHHKQAISPRSRIDGDKSDYLPIQLDLIPKAVSIIVPKDN